MPQIFQAITDYKYINNGTSASLCEMLSVIRPKEKMEKCFVVGYVFFKLIFPMEYFFIFRSTTNQRNKRESSLIVSIP